MPSTIQNPTISTATYNAQNGQLILQGSNFTLSASNYAFNKINLFGDSSNAGLLGVAINYTLSKNSTLVGNPNPNQIIIQLTSADQIAVNALFDANGNNGLNNNPYQLLALSGWDSNANVSSPLGVIVQNAIQPLINSVSFDENKQQFIFSGNFVGNNLILSDFSIQDSDNNTYTFSNDVISNLTASSFSVSISAADKAKLSYLLSTNTNSNNPLYTLSTIAGWDGAASIVGSNNLQVSNAPIKILAQLINPSGLAVDNSGNLYITAQNKSGGVPAIDKISAGSLLNTSLTPIFDNWVPSTPITTNVFDSIALDSSGNIFAYDNVANLWIVPNGSQTLLELTALETVASGFTAETTFDSNGNLLITNNGINIQELSKASLQTNLNNMPLVSAATYDPVSGILSLTGHNLSTTSTAYDFANFQLSNLSFNNYWGLTSSYSFISANSTSISFKLTTIDQQNINQLFGTGQLVLSIGQGWEAGGQTQFVQNVTTANQAKITGITFNATDGQLTFSGNNFLTPSNGTSINLSDFSAGNAALTSNENLSNLTNTSFSVSLSSQDALFYQALITSKSINIASNWDNGLGNAQTNQSVTINNLNNHIQLPASLSLNSMQSDNNGNLYLADSQNAVIDKLSSGNQNIGSIAKLSSLYTGNLANLLMVADKNGNLFLIDPYNNVIKELKAGQNELSSLSYASTNNISLFSPSAIAADKNGNLYIVDSRTNTVDEYQSGKLTNALGTGVTLSNPSAVAVDNNSNIFVYDNGSLKEFAAQTHQETTLITGISISNPQNLQVDSNGNVFFVDSNNNTIKELFAGSNAVETLISNANPNVSIATDNKGNVYYSDLSQNNNWLINILSPANLNSIPIISSASYNPFNQSITLTGSNLATTAAAYNFANFSLQGINYSRYTLTGGSLIGNASTTTVTIQLNATDINQIFANSNLAIFGNITALSLAPSWLAGANAIQIENLTSSISIPTNLPGQIISSSTINIADSNGNLFVAENNNASLIKIPASNHSAQTILAYASLHTARPVSISELFADKNGNLYLLDNANFAIEKLANGSNSLQTLISSGLANASAFTLDQNGNLFVAVSDGAIIEYKSGNFTNPVSLVTSANGTDPLITPTALVADNNSNLYVFDSNSLKIDEINLNSHLLTVLTSAQLANPNQLALDIAGDLYFIDTKTGYLKEIFAGSQTIASLLALPDAGQTNLSFDNNGNLYLSDLNQLSNSVQEINHANLQIPSIISFSFNPVAGTLTLTGNNLSNQVSAYNSSLFEINNSENANSYTLTNSNISQASNNSITFQLTNADLQGINNLGASSLLTLNVAQNWKTGATSQFVKNFSLVNQPQLTNVNYNAVTGVMTFSGSNLLANTTNINLNDFNLILNKNDNIFAITQDSAAYFITNQTSTGFQLSLTGGNKLNASTLLASNNAFTLSVAAGWDNGVGAAFNINSQSIAISNAPQNIPLNPASNQVLPRTNAIISVDNNGNIYIADSSAGTIEKIASGNQSAGTKADINTLYAYGSTQTATLAVPNAGIAIDHSGNLFIADPVNNRIDELKSGKTLATLSISAAAQNGANPTSLNQPAAIALDGNANLYIADSANKTIEIAKASNNYASFTTFIPASAGLTDPTALAIDSKGDLFVYDQTNGNSGNGNLYEFLANSQTAILITTASILNPDTLTVDNQGNLYFLDASSSAIYKVPTGTQNVETLIRPGLSPNTVSSLSMDASGNLYLTNNANGWQITEYSVNSLATIPTISTASFNAVTHSLTLTGTNLATTAAAYNFSAFNLQNGSIASGWTSALSLTGGSITSNSNANTVTIQLNAADINSLNLLGASYQNLAFFNGLTVSGGWMAGGDLMQVQNMTYTGLLNVPVNTTQLGSINTLSSDSNGNLFVVDNTNHNLLKVTASSHATSIIPFLNTPNTVNITNISADNNGNIYLLDTANNAIDELKANTSTLNNIAANLNLNNPQAIALDNKGNLFIVSSGNTLNELKAGSHTLSTIGTPFTNVTAIEVDNSGNIYVFDTNELEKFSINAQNQLYANLNNGVLLAANIANANAMTLDTAGDLFYIDATKNTLNEVLSGSENVISLEQLTDANYDTLSFDGKGNLYIADSSQNSIVELTSGSFNNLAVVKNVTFDAQAGTLTLNGSNLATLATAFNFNDFAFTSNSSTYSLTGGVLQNGNNSSNLTIKLNTTDQQQLETLFTLGVTNLLLTPGWATASPAQEIQNITEKNQPTITGVSFNADLHVLNFTGTNLNLTAGTPINLTDINIHYSSTNPYYQQILTDGNYQSSFSLSSSDLISNVSATGFSVALQGQDRYDANIFNFTKVTGSVNLIAGWDNSFGNSQNNIAVSYIAPTNNGYYIPIITGNNNSINIHSLFSDKYGNLYYTDSYNDQINKIAAGSQNDRSAIDVKTLYSGTLPSTILVADNAGDVFVADPNNNAIAELKAGNSQQTSFQYLSTPGLITPSGLAIDSNGNLYISDSGDNTIKEYTPGSGNNPGKLTTLLSGLNNPAALVVDNKGDLFVSNQGMQQILEFAANTRIETVLLSGVNVNNMLITPSGNLRVFDANNNDTSTTILLGPAASGNTAVSDTILFSQNLNQFSNVTDRNFSVDGNGYIYESYLGDNGYWYIEASTSIFVPAITSATHNANSGILTLYGSQLASSNSAYNFSQFALSIGTSNNYTPATNPITLTGGNIISANSNLVQIQLDKVDQFSINSLATTSNSSFNILSAGYDWLTADRCPSTTNTQFYY